MPSISAIVITKNEAFNIQRCLKSLHFCDEVILIDSCSTDDTLTLARQFPHVKCFVTKWPGFVKAKQIALRRASHDWILWVDADEEVSVSLQQAWNQVKVHLGENVAAFEVERHTYFLNTRVKYCGWTNHIVRFFHKGLCRFDENAQLHEKILVPAGFKILKLNGPLLHYSYSSLYQYFDKMNRYGYSGALQKQSHHFFFAQIFIKPFWTFFRSYFLQKGILDGKIGFIICVGSAFSHFIRYTNLYFLKLHGRVSYEGYDAEASKNNCQSH